MKIKPVKFEDGKLILIDQTLLPEEYKEMVCNTYKDVDNAIQTMIVRGAPAIGGSAAYGVVMAANEFKNLEKESFLKELDNACTILNKSRPTAVNLMWAISKMRTVIKENKDEKIDFIIGKLLEEAIQIDKDDIASNLAIGEYGNKIIPHGATILTHCNTGALATMGHGTALGVIRSAHYSDKEIFVYSDETRPRFQGSKLTAWELMKENIPSKTIIDSVAATLIRDKKIDVIIVGADRIVSNGDTANKIGTFMLSALAKVYDVPFYIAAPLSTIDLDMEVGEEIDIEERCSEEVTLINGKRVAPKGMDVFNPGFDVTPGENITGIITEKGIVTAPYKENLAKLFKSL